MRYKCENGLEVDSKERLAKAEKSSSQSMATKRGFLFVFEGCDRSGKSTQARKLVEALKAKGKSVKFMRYPERDSKTGVTISQYLEKKIELDDLEVHKLFSKNRWEFNEQMRQDLKSGTALIIDRYAYSGVAYTLAKSIKGCTIESLKDPDRGLPAPDKVFYLDMPPNKVASRGGFGEERYETSPFQEKVYNAYEQLKDDTWKVIDADQIVDEVHAEISKTVSEIEAKSICSELKSLWMD
eukprot:gene10847-12000_t